MNIKKMFPIFLIAFCLTAVSIGPVALSQTESSNCQTGCALAQCVSSSLNCGGNQLQSAAAPAKCSNAQLKCFTSRNQCLSEQLKACLAKSAYAKALNLLGCNFKQVKAAVTVTPNTLSQVKAATNATGKVTQYTVKCGNTILKFTVKTQCGLTETVKTSPQPTNSNPTYPGGKVDVPTTDSVKAIENEVIRLTNVERAKYGLSPLSANGELSRMARYKSQDMIDHNYFDHNSPVYGSPFKMMTSFGISYSTAGENIAMGQRTAQEVVTAWMNSPGHRANILNKNFKQIGVGYAKSANGTIYWSQEFIG